MTNDLTNEHDEKVIDLTKFIKIIKKNYLAIIYIFIILFLLYFLKALYLSDSKLFISTETELKPASTFTITELESILRVEEIKTTGTLPADVLSDVEVKNKNGKKNRNLHRS